LAIVSRSEDERLWAALAHASIIFSIIGPLVVYLVKKDESYWVGRHAIQALIYQAAVWVVLIILSIVLGVITTIALGGMAMTSSGAAAASGLGIASVAGCCWPIVALAALAYALYGAYQCYQGKSFKYVIIGDLVSGL
jgi:uncharacterized Tic20 family protein